LPVLHFKRYTFQNLDNIVIKYLYLVDE